VAGQSVGGGLANAHGGAKAAERVNERCSLDRGCRCFNSRRGDLLFASRHCSLLMASQRSREAALLGGLALPADGREGTGAARALRNDRGCEGDHWRGLAVHPPGGLLV